MLKKNRENVEVDKKSAYVIYEWSPSIVQLVFVWIAKEQKNSMKLILVMTTTKKLVICRAVSGIAGQYTIGANLVSII